jgi:hypothetical protein
MLYRSYHPVRRWLHQWRGIRPFRKVLLGAVVLLGFFTIGPFPKPSCRSKDWIDPTDAQPHYHPDLMHTDARSQRTLHFPFRTGCPQDCQPFRAARACPPSRSSHSNLRTATGPEDFFRVTVEWYFGNATQYDPRLSWDAQNGATDTAKGVDFQAPQSFVATFQAAARDLKEQGERRLKLPGKAFKVHTQKFMHVSLSYLCCLSAEEAAQSLPVIDRWMAETEFNFALAFAEIQSWHESPNSVTNIVVADEASQRNMMHLNHDLNQHLAAAGVPVVIPREDQMPFHATLAGFRYSKKGETYDPQYEIASQLPTIYSLVDTVSNDHRSNWNIGGPFHVQHKPMRSPEPKSHTHPLADKVP